MSTPLETKSGSPLENTFLTGSKRKTLIIVFSFVILLGLVTSFLQQKYVPPIIMYHMVSLKIDPPVQGLIVSPATFERQMQFLRNHHYNIITPEAMAALIKDKKKIPAKTIAVTFDDGYKDNYTNAFPILKKYNIPATIFIIVSEMGRSQNDRLSWDEIKIMQDSGIITFGSHCLGPDPLTNLKSEKEIKRQIFDSKKVLEEKLGRKVNTFSYPEGRFNEQIRQFVIDAGYKLAVTANLGSKYLNDDIFALKRLRISENAKNLFIFWFETSGYYTFLKGRRK